MSVTLQNIITAISAKANIDNASGVCDNVSIDSRSPQNNNKTLFFAFGGPNHDAHIYIEDLIPKGFKKFGGNLYSPKS